MQLKRRHIIVYTCAAIIVAILLAPNFCQCPGCVVMKPNGSIVKQPCYCSMFGVFLGRKVWTYITTGGKGFAVQAPGVAKTGCGTHGSTGRSAT